MEALQISENVAVERELNRLLEVTLQLESELRMAVMNANRN